MWAFGDFFADVPQRLGKNDVLDAAAAVLVSGHNDIRMHKGQVSFRTLRLHGHALSILRACLNDPVEAQAVNTLCAVYLLLICQSLTGTWDSWTPSHTEGAVQILRSKTRHGIIDDFEKRLLLTLRGPVIFEGLFNPRIDLSPDEWELLLFDNRKCTRRIDRILVYLADMPSCLRRGTNLKAGVYFDPNFVEVVRFRYSATKVATDELHTLLVTFEAENNIQDDNALIHLTYQRIYGLALFVTLVLNCLLSALTEPSDLIALEAEAFAHDVILLASQSHRYRPLGSAYITICLYGAFAAAKLQTTKNVIFQEIERYCSDFPPPKDTNHLEVVENSVRHLTLS
ncbi:hypothetical protein LTR64_000773 [Lithohypha guttulata]|uniref:uncharacterized protein n=1 Tax=Lithohypha guttulata TaxID=1690604 RepID=UPI002DE133FD|nr:hypothetical protein LTR51_005460 [Lithohypha guttulata]